MIKHILPFGFGIILTVVSYKLGGIIDASTTNVGEIIIFKGIKESEVEDMMKHPGTTSYCIGEITG